MSSIKSKPVYEPLRADPSGRFHLLVGYAEGCNVLRRVLEELAAAGNTRILFAGAGADAFAAVPAAAVPAAAFPTANIHPSDIQAFEGLGELLQELRAVLERSVMGTRLYITGPENFIGRVLQIALEFDLKLDEIRAEEVGTRARRVRCVHCRATTEDVTMNIVRCSGCSRWLLVRDHYSRRHAAYMGVMADAEVRGDLPPLHEAFP